MFTAVFMQAAVPLVASFAKGVAAGVGSALCASMVSHHPHTTRERHYSRSTDNWYLNTAKSIPLKMSLKDEG